MRPRPPLDGITRPQHRADQRRDVALRHIEQGEVRRSYLRVPSFVGLHVVELTDVPICQGDLVCNDLQQDTPTQAN
jgi:hypothetical protein